MDIKNFKQFLDAFDLQTMPAKDAVKKYEEFCYARQEFFIENESLVSVIFSKKRNKTLDKTLYGFLPR